MAKDPRAVEEYVDGNGNTFQLNEADAKRLGYAKAAGGKAARAEQVETKVVEAEPGTKPPAKRTATTK